MASFRRTVDIVVAALLLIIVSMPLLVIGLIVRADSPGPALFRQTRLGKDLRPFVLLKFRTMYSDASSRFPDLYDYAAKTGSDDFQFKARGDPRVTRVGKFLRRSALDELPNLINVLKGDCALVGPRPDIPEMLAFYSDKQRERFTVRPGLFCLAHINGANRLTFNQTADLDVEYVTTRSWKRDIQILFLGVRAIMRGDLH